MTNVLMIGMGNPFRGDDGAGLAVARLLREQHPPDLTIMEATGDSATLMESWRNAATVILVDAVHSHAPAGTIFRFDALHEQLPARVLSSSTHTFGVAEAIELSRLLGWLPPVVIVYGIEGGTYKTGAALSPAVASAVGRLADRITKDLHASAIPVGAS